MQVHCDEGVATHIGPKPCAGIREDVGEASAGERAGQPLSRDRKLIPGADTVCVVEGNMSKSANASTWPGPPSAPVRHCQGRRVLRRWQNRSALPRITARSAPSSSWPIPSGRQLHLRFRRRPAASRRDFGWRRRCSPRPPCTASSKRARHHSSDLWELTGRASTALPARYHVCAAPQPGAAFPSG